MKTLNKDINQKFLLALLNTTDAVYSGGIDEGFYFYPKDLGFTVQVPFAHHSTFVDVNFVFEKPGGRDSEKDVVNLSFGTIDEVQEFMNQLYKKHEKMLNSHRVLPEAIDKFEEALIAPLGKGNPYTISGSDENIKLTEKTNDYELTINLGRALFNFENEKKIKPLEPIVIDCFYRPSESDRNEYFKKVVAAYKVDEYPILAKLANINPTIQDIHTLSDALLKVNPKSGKALSAFLLDVELDKKDGIKNNRPKI
jgi:hypothetical protein